VFTSLFIIYALKNKGFEAIKEMFYHYKKMKAHFSFSHERENTHTIFGFASKLSKLSIDRIVHFVEAQITDDTVIGIKQISI